MNETSEVVPTSEVLWFYAIGETRSTRDQIPDA